MSGSQEKLQLLFAPNATAPIGTEIKKCKKCGGTYPLDKYSPAKENRDRFSHYCKYCMAAYTREYRSTHLDQCRSYDRAHTSRHNERKRKRYTENPEKYRAERREYYYKNKQSCLDVAKNWKKNNPIKVLSKQREYRKLNPQPYRDAAKRRKILKRNITVEVFPSIEIYERDNWICQLCKKRVDKRWKYPNPMSPSIDHIIPLSDGGLHERKNVQLAHLHCNVKTGTGGIKQTRLIA
jgi:hypothetical protein